MDILPAGRVAAFVTEVVVEELYSVKVFAEVEDRLFQSGRPGLAL